MWGVGFNMRNIKRPQRSENSVWSMIYFLRNPPKANLNENSMTIPEKLIVQNGKV